MELLAVDKCTLILPETKELYRQFGAHGGSRGIGPVNVEICCVFNALARIPRRLVFSPCHTSEFSLFDRLVKYFDRRHLVLIDNGFYSLRLFSQLLAHHAHFIIPMANSCRPEVIRPLGSGDYLCQISSVQVKEKYCLRVIYVYRNGFRRRRLLTSLLDPEKYPAKEIAAIYHARWNIETFYREFKSSMEGKRWHCQGVHSFEIELISKMILACMVRLAGAEAAKPQKIFPSKISFAQTLTEFKCFLRQIILLAKTRSWQELYDDLIKKVSKCILRHRNGRDFSRDQQQYRRKSRGLEKRRGRPPKPVNDNHKPEIQTIYKQRKNKRLQCAILLS